MAQLIKPFNARNIQPFGGGSQQLPHGEKMLVCIEAFETRSKAQDSSQGGVDVKLRVKDGPNNGAYGSMWLAMYDGNPAAQQLAEQKLSAICHVTGQLDIGTNLDVLLNIDFRVDVGQQKKDPTKSDVLAFYDVNGTPVNEVARNAHVQNTAAVPQFQQALVQQQAAPAQTFGQAAPAQAAAPVQGAFGQAPAQAAFGQQPAQAAFGQQAPAAFPAQGAAAPFAAPAQAPQPAPSGFGGAWGAPAK